MVLALRLTLVLLLAATAAGAAPSLLRKQPAAVKPGVDSPKKPNMDEPIMVAEPMMVVVLDGGDGGEEPPQPSARHGDEDVDMTCMKQAFVLGFNETHAMLADKCEDKGDYSQRALKAMQAGNQTMAQNLIETSFTKCAEFSKTCASQMAKQTIRKLRFSGLAVSKECMHQMDVMHADKKKDADAEKCEKEHDLGKKLTAALNNQNLEAATDVAAEGLSKCHGIKHPCDDQIAPVIVTQIVQDVMRQQAQEMLQAMMPLFAGAMEHANQMEKAVAPRSMTKGKIVVAANTSKSAAAIKKAPARRISLLSVARKLRLVKATF